MSMKGIAFLRGTQVKPVKRLITKSEQGFTMVELIVSLVVGAIFVGSMTLVVTSHAHLSQRGLDVTVANSYAENKVEELRSQGFLALSDGTTNITSELPTELKNPRSGSLQISSFATDIKQVAITITYNDQGTSRNYSYTTLIGELGVGQY
jgi:prepilin-type N-terminal cleavage/methylation domain-containing protein